MRDLSNLLWCDLQSDEERIEFLESGLAQKTGVIAASLVRDFAEALRFRVASKSESLKFN